jgi:hypothetical protein
MSFTISTNPARKSIGVKPAWQISSATLLAMIERTYLSSYEAKRVAVAAIRRAAVLRTGTPASTEATLPESEVVEGGRYRAGAAGLAVVDSPVDTKLIAFALGSPPWTAERVAQVVRTAIEADRMSRPRGSEVR